MPLTNAQKQANYRSRKKEEAKAKIGGELLQLNIVEFFQRVTKLTPTEQQKRLYWHHWSCIGIIGTMNTQNGVYG
jgi:hypothetical protein